MDIKVKLEPEQHDYDTGGGYRESTGTITIDSKLPYRRQREILLYEGLGLLFDTMLTHEAIENAASVLDDLLDQMEALSE